MDPHKRNLVELQLSLLDSYVYRHQVQSKLINRLFCFFLIVAAAPLPLLCVLLQIKIISLDSTSGINMTWQGFLFFMSSFFLILGLFFLIIHTRQQNKSIEFNFKINSIEEKIFKRLNPKDSYLVDQYKYKLLGTDLYYAMIYIFINSIWASLAAYFFASSSICDCYAFKISLLVVATSMVLQFILRSLLIFKPKKSA